MTLQELMQLTVAVTKDSRLGLDYRKLVKKSLPDFKSMTEKELYDLRDNEIIPAMEARQQKADQEGRDESEDEKKSFAACDAVINVIDRHIDYRKAEGIAGALEIPRGLHDHKMLPMGGNPSVVQTRIEDPRKVTFRSLWPHIQPTARRELNTWGKLLGAIAAKIHHPELEEARTMMLGSGPLGSYGVGPQLEEAFVDGLIEASRILQLCNLIPGGESGEVRIPVYDNSDHSVSLYGGISREFPGENAAATPSDAKMRLVTMILHRLCIYCNVTNILLQASPQKEMELRRILVESVAYSVEESILVGSGIGQPRGIVDSPGAVVVNRTTANSIVFSDIVNMFARLAPGSQARAIWVANYNILPSLLTMQDPGNRYIWNPVGYSGASQAIPATLLGREIVFTEKSPALGSKGDIVLCDFKGYAVCLTPQIGVQTSDAPRWYENERSFRIETRVDGTMLLDEPIVPRKGSQTLSTTVVLNA